MGGDGKGCNHLLQTHSHPDTLQGWIILLSAGPKQRTPLGFGNVDACWRFENGILMLGNLHSHPLECAARQHLQAARIEAKKVCFILHSTRW